MVGSSRLMLKELDRDNTKPPAHIDPMPSS
jgi:hypothetical protein